MSEDPSLEQPLLQPIKTLHPLETSWFPSRYIFWWVGTTISKARKTPFTQEMHYPLPEEDTFSRIFSKFAALQSSQSIKNEQGGSNPTKKNKIRVIFMVIKAYYIHVILAMFYGVLSALLSLLNIYLTDSLISVLSENKDSPEKAN